MSEHRNAPRAPNGTIRRVTRLTVLGLSALTLAAAGCDADEPVTPTAEPLRQVEIPEDFTFSMSRGLSLEVTADEALAFHAPLAVQVSLPDGGKLYRGPIEAGAAKHIEVLAPRAADELVIELTGRSKALSKRVAVDGANLQVTLR
jgi:hypothetical protein